MTDLKKLKEDVEQMYARTSCGNQHSLDLVKPTLSEVLNLIDEHEALLKKRGQDKLQAVSLITKFIEESVYTIKDTEDKTLQHHDPAVQQINGEFVCGLVNNLNKHGYPLAKKAS
jgi:ElaB/YqjD/DUF883 family membrane-anchored ribosome-binding protein